MIKDKINIYFPFYHMNDNKNEITIECGKHFVYSEIGKSHSGFQGGMKNDTESHKICREISTLVKKLVDLNLDK